jgi:hypothetical protein
MLLPCVVEVDVDTEVEKCFVEEQIVEVTVVGRHGWMKLNWLRTQQLRYWALNEKMKKPWG